jgi:mannose-1-phosphate guanylyltransferase
LNYEVDSLILEHEGRNTGPAIASAALTLDDNTLMLVLPIDHYISDERAFLKRITDISAVLSEDQTKIASLFVTKTSTESNYGHLKLGKQLNCTLPVFAVDNFIEKPEVDDEDKNIVWNSGIYLMTTQTCKNMMSKNAPHILNHSQKAVTKGIERKIKGLRELILNFSHFSKNSKLSFDQILTMPYNPQSLISTHIGTAWEDVGIWSGIKRLCEDLQHASAINKELFKYS